MRRLREVAAGWSRLAPLLEPLLKADKLGPVLWQMPETFHRDDERLDGALAALPDRRHCFEFRHESWFVPEVEKILRAHRAALVIGIDPSRPFQTLSRTTDWTYLRFHRGRGHEGNFTPLQLDEWAEHIRAWLADGDVFAYFKGDWGGHAIREAQRMRELVRPP